MNVMGRTVLLACAALALVACSPRSDPSPVAEASLVPGWESEFDRLFLSLEPLRYQDNVQFLASVDSAALSPQERELIRTKLKEFLSSQPKPRPYAPDSEHTGLSPEVSFLRLQAVGVLAKVGARGDASFIRNLEAVPGGEHPLFDEACQKAIETLESR